MSFVVKSCASLRVDIRCVCSISKMSNAAFQPKSYNAFDIGVYLSAVKCLLIAAESFR